MTEKKAPSKPTSPRRRAAGTQPKSKATKKRSRVKKTQRGAAAGIKGVIARYWLKALWLGIKVAVALLAVLFLYAIYLDSKIQSRFEGNKWQLPSQLYARPLLLEPGMRLSQRWLLDELALLRYQPVKKLTHAGQYIKRNDRIELIRRPFDFLHGSEQALGLSLRFKGHRLSQLNALDSGRSIKRAWLDPVLIDRMQTRQREDRILVPLDQYSPLLFKTLLLVEDRDFYQHNGISMQGILRAFYANMKAGRTVQGGSTLTQQLAKNFFLTSSRSFVRKAQEAVMALVIDFRYSKEEILETYLNEVYLGQNFASGVHGFGLGSYFYFGRPVGELSIDQMATLVALVKGPSYYDPWKHPKRLLARRDLILRLMVENNYIEREQYEVAVAQSLDLVPRGEMNFGKTPAYVSLVRLQLKQLFGDSLDNYQGVKIFSNLDPVAQKSAELSVAKTLDKLPDNKALQAAMVVTDRLSGRVLALVAGRDPEYSGFNRVMDAVRPIGSLVKPFVYLTALTQGFQLGSILEDKPISMITEDGKRWEPRNYNREYAGQVPFYIGLMNSLNLPTVYLGMKVGVDKVLQQLKQAGLTKAVSPYPSVLLGSVTLSPYQVAQLYQTLATQGKFRPLSAVRGVMTDNGTMLYQESSDAKQVLPDQESYLTLYNMTLVTRKGTAKRLLSQFPRVSFAGKTGTTDDNRDSWFVGMDQRDLVTVWVGRDDNKATGVTGSSGALPLFSEYMKLRRAESLRLAVPDGIEWAHFDPESGEVTLPECAAGIRLPAIADRLPEPTKCGLTEWSKSLFGF